MKFKGLIAVAALALLVTGCSDTYTNVSEGKTVVMTVGGVEVKKSDVYGFLLANDGANVTLSAVMGHIMDTNVEVTDELTAEATKQLADLKDNLGDEFTAFIESYGYKSEEDYFEKVIMYNLKSTKLISKYVETKFDAFALTQKPRKVQIIEVDDKDKAQLAHDQLTAGKTFEEVGKEYGSLTYNGVTEVLLAETDLDSIVVAAIQNTTTAKRIDEILEATNGKFYLVNVVEGDPEKFKDEAIEALTNVASISDEATRAYLRDAKFEIHDKLIFDQVKQSAPDLIFD